MAEDKIKWVESAHPLLHTCSECHYEDICTGDNEEKWMTECNEKDATGHWEEVK